MEWFSPTKSCQVNAETLLISRKNKTVQEVDNSSNGSQNSQQRDYKLRLINVKAYLNHLDFFPCFFLITSSIYMIPLPL